VLEQNFFSSKKVWKGKRENMKEAWKEYKKSSQNAKMVISSAN